MTKRKANQADQLVDSPGINYGSPRTNNRNRNADPDSSALELLRSNSSVGGLENVLGNADAIFMNQNSSDNMTIDHDSNKNFIPAKNSN
jgi:hypothetical protein